MLMTMSGYFLDPGNSDQLDTANHPTKRRYACAVLSSEKSTKNELF